MPDNTDEKKELGKKLQQYNTSLQEFNESLNRDEIQLSYLSSHRYSVYVFS